MFPILTLTGKPSERGRQYGRETAPLVRHSIASYARLFAYRRGMDWAEVQRAALAYVPLLEDVAGELVAEMRGIAEGSGRSFAEIVALNARTELLAGHLAMMGADPGYEAATVRNRAVGVPGHDEQSATTAIFRQSSPTDRGECTTVVALPRATAAGETLLAQNWDWSADQRSACVLLRILSPDRPDILTITEAGIVAKIGLNRAGVGVCLNILATASDGQAPGMPVHVLLRLMLQTERAEEAIELAGRVRMGASSCVTVADPHGRAVCLELAPSGVGVIEPQDGMLVHTNHCVAANLLPVACALPPTSSSVPRHDRATMLLASMRGRIDHAVLAGVLRDHTDGVMGICRHPDPAIHPADRVESVLGVVMDLGRGMMHVAPDVPCLTRFTAVALEE